MTCWTNNPHRAVGASDGHLTCHEQKAKAPRSTRNVPVASAHTEASNPPVVSLRSKKGKEMPKWRWDGSEEGMSATPRKDSPQRK